MYIHLDTIPCPSFTPDRRGSESSRFLGGGGGGAYSFFHGCKKRKEMWKPH